MQKKYWRHVLGQNAEREACRYLKKQGLMLVIRNYWCRLGEIDLIMRDGKILVFIEIRLRTNLSYGNGLDSVTIAKQRKIIRTAQYYLLVKHLTHQVPCRFDVVSVAMKNNKFDFLWVKNAFEV